LRELDEAALADIAMTAVSYTNSLHGDEALKRQQRVHARFINNAMMATLLGEVVSDTLADGRVVSGVGGQYEFVAQAHALDGGRGIIALPSTNQRRGKPGSNILWSYPHVTVPRHLRDIIVTEYGVADLRGKSDRDCIAGMLAITDARFQRSLAETAQRGGKLERDWAPASDRQNSPEHVARALAPFQAEGHLPEYPFGTDLTPIEQRLARGLRQLKTWSHDKPRMALRAVRGLFARALDEPEREALARLGLAHPKGAREHLERALLLVALREQRGESAP
jgi:hypothetical protein